jgi:hypothetical protein
MAPVEGAAPTGFASVGPSDKDLDSLRTYFDRQLAEADRRYEVRYNLTDKALTKEQASNEVRLSNMNEFRAALADQTARLPTRVEVETMIRAVHAESEKVIAPIAIKLDAINRPNWILLFSMGTVMVSIVSAAWVIIGLKIDATNLPVQVSIQAAKSDWVQLDQRMTAVETLAVASSQADSVSRADRSQVNVRVGVLEEASRQNTTDVRTLNATTSAKLVEVETQFKLLSDILNLDKDQDQRLLTLLWQRTFPGELLPPVNFRPQMFKGNE